MKPTSFIEKKPLGIFAALATVVAILFAVYTRERVPDYHYFSVDCSIYTKSGKILFYTSGQLCAFSDDGKLLTSDPNSNVLRMADSAGNVVWTARENIHHDLKFTEDQNAFLAISGEIIQFDGKPVRSDCFSKRDLKNTILSEWCLGANIPQLKKLGFRLRTQPSDAFAINQLVYASEEISHANSIYEIPDSKLSAKHPAFRKGNFLVDLHSPLYALLILDSEMKTVLWSKSLEHLPYGIKHLSFSAHDTQITPDGKILSFINFYKTREPKLHLNDITQSSAAMRPFNWGSSLVEIDPISNSIDWIYEADPPDKFRSMILGSVTLLKNANYLFSDITAKLPVIFEVNRERKVIWKFEIPDHGSSDSTIRIRKVKPIYNPGFLQARALID